MDIGIDGVWGLVAKVAIIVTFAYLLIVWVASVVWTYRDVSARTRDPFSQTVSLILAIAFPILGLLVYLPTRPRQTLAEAYDHQLEAEALLHEIQEQATCPSCRRRVDDDFIACPYCRTSLRSPCESCGKALATTWVLCPYCASPRTPVVVPNARRNAAAIADEPTVEIAASGRQKRPASTATYTPPAAKSPPTDTPADA
ncbi:MAG: zinc ribbon domain-containing protein [Chloroflexi bacterium]|nr:zinc ribbon domain-containing protein [Chloroflexota bacterium]